jgi:beta-glucosidase
MECTRAGDARSCGGEIPVDEQMRGAPKGQWNQVRILLTCFEQHGTSMQSVTAPLVITSAGALQMSIANVKLDAGPQGAMPCP